MKLTLSARKLTDALTFTIPFVSNDRKAPLPGIEVVRIIPTDTGIAFVATDRYVLSEYVVPIGDDVTVTDPVEVSIPLETAKAWLKMVKAMPELMPAVIVADDLTVSLTVYEQTIGDRAQESQWVPDYTRLFPADAGDDRHGQSSTVFSTDIIVKLTKPFRGRVPLVFAFGETPAKPVTVSTPSEPNWRAIIMPGKVDR